MSKSENICDHDCFHCKYKDCKYSGSMTKYESKILSAAHRDWEQEAKEKNVMYMHNHGYLNKEIQAYLHLTQPEVKNIIIKYRGKK